jgi:phage terminase large subunit-like protein
MSEWQPRPDDDMRQDQQTSFFETTTSGISFLLGGNGSGTTETMMAKLAHFVLRLQPPPRRDTPFWIIAGSYEQVCEACWKEKLHGHGHIPDDMVEWDRVNWIKPKQNWPKTVPLKPWPGNPDTNWVLEFKSWRQGRDQMQARSLGGFAFSEQYPQIVFDEVFRGCREYSFRGNKLVEYTPVDPDLSYRLQEMIEQDRLPPRWRVFYCNTECARDAGHVSEAWYEEFFGMIPDEMRDVRQRGRFAGFEGLIYPSFNATIHCPPAEKFDHPADVDYRRAIDWGYGDPHAYCCLLAYRDRHGRWWIFDEIYIKKHGSALDKLKETSDYCRDVWGWKVRHPRFGTAWADSANPGDIEIANKLSAVYPDSDAIPMQSAPKRIDAGVEVVQRLLKVDPHLGTPRLFIHPKNCPNLKRQLRTYRWEKAAGETGVNPKDPRRTPLKKDDHAVDPLRYMLHAEDHCWSQAPADGETRDDTTRIERVSHGHSADPVTGTHGVRLQRKAA